MGTYRYSPTDNDPLAEINVGGSLFKLPSGGHQAETAGFKIPTVRRESREWDLVDGRYRYLLTLINASCVGALECVVDTDDCFWLRWTRKSMNMKRQWSNKIRANAALVGTL